MCCVSGDRYLEKKSIFFLFLSLDKFDALLLGQNATRIVDVNIKGSENQCKLLLVMTDSLFDVEHVT